MTDHNIYQVQIDAIKEDIAEIKTDLKEQKESYIENMFILRENLTRLTSLMEKHDEHLRKQDYKLEKQEAMLSSITKKSEMQPEQKSDATWYQRVLENKDKFFMYILLILLAFSLGLRTETITGFLGGR